MNILGKPVAIGGGAGWELAPESWATGLVDRTLSGSVYGSMVLTVRSSAFAYCHALTGVEFPACVMIGTGAFQSCSALTTASFPACVMIGSTAFYSCWALTTVSFPACTRISDYAFSNCSALTTASFPACTSISYYAFCSCSALTTASFPACTRISGVAFASCIKLVSFYLTGSRLCTLGNSNAFNSTPIGGYSASAKRYGSIYVPASLLASYQAATNWTYFSSRFVGV